MKARSFWPLALGYIGLRILLTVLIAVVVVLVAQLAGLDMPVLVAAMLAVIVQLPLAWLILGGMRRRLTGRVAASAGERRRLRGELQAALQGQQTSSEVHTPSHPAVPGAPTPSAGTAETPPDEIGRP